MQFKVNTNLRPGFSASAQQFIARQLKKVADNGKQTFDTITDNWEHKPDFKASMTQSGTVVTLSVLTDSDIFHWVDQGTQPHREPKNGRRFMAFQAAYSPRTNPGRLQFNPNGGESSGDTIFAQTVNHPGIAPRNFSERVGKEMQRDIIRIVGPSIRRLPL